MGRRPVLETSVAEADIGQYDWYDSGECEKRDHLCPMFGRCVPDVQDARNGVRPDTLAESAQRGEEQQDSVNKRRQSYCPDNDRSVPTEAAAAMRGSGASDNNIWGSAKRECCRSLG